MIKLKSVSGTLQKYVAVSDKRRKMRYEKLTKMNVNWCWVPTLWTFMNSSCWSIIPKEISLSNFSLKIFQLKVLQCKWLHSGKIQGFQGFFTEKFFSRLILNSKESDCITKIIFLLRNKSIQRLNVKNIKIFWSLRNNSKNSRTEIKKATNL